MCPVSRGLERLQGLVGPEHAHRGGEHREVGQQAGALEREDAVPARQQGAQASGDHGAVGQVDEAAVGDIRSHQIVVAPPGEHDALSGHGAGVHKEAGGHKGHQRRHLPDHRRVAHKEAGAKEQNGGGKRRVGDPHDGAREQQAPAESLRSLRWPPDSRRQEGLACHGHRIPKHGKEDEDGEGHVVPAGADGAHACHQAVQHGVHPHLG
mmetsp:Transcript_3106/g.7906  ORF Transcript_3106/g.7906 Transcript_3106/m.7906 type:complete len:209 (+) Transcript_3106:208-834(+)